jgi:hypothetical protein
VYSPYNLEYVGSRDTKNFEHSIVMHGAKSGEKQEENVFHLGSNTLARTECVAKV